MRILATLLMLIFATPAYADESPQIPEPVFVHGFGELSDQLGEVMGAPLEDEHPATDADAVQITTKGIAVYRRGELPTFFNGWEKFTLKTASPIFAVSASSRIERQADCIIARESGGNPNAVNPRSKASGLGQFLSGTWASTPQGKAGYSVFNPQANRAAVIWMLQNGRTTEFVTWRGC